MCSGNDDGLCCRLTRACPKEPEPIPFKDLEVKRSEIVLAKKLGQGQFGEVWAGKNRKHNIYRQDAAKRQTAGIKFSHRPKIRFLAPQGRLVAPIQVKLGRANGHLGPLG